MKEGGKEGTNDVKKGGKKGRREIGEEEERPLLTTYTKLMNRLRSEI
jgi:hypothetical protein